MLQKRVKNLQEGDSNFLVPLYDYTPPSMVKCLHINLDCKNNAELDCCKNVEIFEDDLENPLNPNNSDVQSVEISNDSDLIWFQSKIILHGFKACNANLW